MAESSDYLVIYPNGEVRSVDSPTLTLEILMEVWDSKNKNDIMVIFIDPLGTEQQGYQWIFADKPWKHSRAIPQDLKGPLILRMKDGKRKIPAGLIKRVIEGLKIHEKENLIQDM